MTTHDNSHTATQMLRTAIATLDARAALRDTPDGERSMSATVNAFNALTGKDLSEVEGWQFMALLKLARAQHGNVHTDDYIDGAAYMALAGEAAAKAEGIAA